MSSIDEIQTIGLDCGVFFMHKGFVFAEESHKLKMIKFAKAIEDVVSGYKVICECNKVRLKEDCSLGYHQSGRSAPCWYCDECIPF